MDEAKEIRKLSKLEVYQILKNALIVRVDRSSSEIYVKATPDLYRWIVSEFYDNQEAVKKWETFRELDASATSTILDYIRSNGGTLTARELTEFCMSERVSRYFSAAEATLEKLPAKKEDLGIEEEDDAKMMLYRYIAKILGKDEYQDLLDPNVLAIAHWMFLSVKMWKDKDFANPYILALQGEQGIGKTMTVRALLSPFFERTSETRWRFESKDFRIETSRNMFMFWDDFNCKGVDIDALKEQTSKKVFRERKVWAQTTSTLYRMCSYICTTNNANFINDATGTRRWLTVKIDKKIDFELVKKYAPTMWGLANMYVTKNLNSSTIMMPKEVEEYFKEINSAAQVTDHIQDALAEMFVACEPAFGNPDRSQAFKDRRKMTIAEIAEYIKETRPNLPIPAHKLTESIQDFLLKGKFKTATKRSANDPTRYWLQIRRPDDEKESA